MRWESSPYRHAIGTGFFEESFYQDMLKSLPPFEEYKQYNEQYKNRYLYLGKNGRPAKGIWAEVWKILENPWHGNAVVQLCRDKPGYYIGPHTDKPTKKKTFLFYLTDKEVEGAGTSVFVPEEKVSASGWTHHDFNGFREVKRAPYVPNGYFAFERSDESFHGVFPCSITRNLIQLSVYG